MEAVTDLRPGETGMRLVADPYYGMVDLGPKPVPKEGETEVPTESDPLDELAQKIEDGLHVLTGEEQTHIEVLYGRRLQQKAIEPRPPETEEPPAEPPV